MSSAIKSSAAQASSPERNRRPPASGVFHLASVDKTAVPDGCDGDDWYRYVIENGRSTITGCRRGSLKQVTEHAKAYVEELNARVGGRGSSTWAPRKKR